MERIIVIGLAAVGLCGCGTAGSADFQHFMDGVKEIASNPACGHIDRIQGNLGGLTGNNLSVYLERTCPAKDVAPAPPAATSR